MQATEQQEASVEPDAAGVVMGTVGGTHTDTKSGKRFGSHRKAAPGSFPHSPARPNPANGTTENISMGPERRQTRCLAGDL